MIRGAAFDTLTKVTAVSLDLLVYERTLIERGEIVVGVDEVGRGALAGPLTVGAVVLDVVGAPPEGLDDSKRLTARQRSALVGPLQSWAADWSLGSASAEEIDAWGLRLALAVAATRALAGLTIVPTYALVDGSFNLLRAPLNGAFDVEGAPRLAYENLAVTTVVRGDQACASIAAASVLAKVSRDRFMVGLHDQFSQYGWAGNKGYGAASHLEAIRQWGPTTYHRRSWQLPERRLA